ncbi:hypothetical protein C4C37_28605 (plasmid) [Pseudomonas amygdali pv. lachrymans]|uniref:Uncharacterized protein n=2 Tax=Pseudomonas amygdali TaxID=47877 RepID=A0ABR5KK43_PSEAV|nr:Unknown protein sequence [Pseudomonas amygdali pv. lachrymans]KPX54457.1 hypothetical protein ALO53_200001 [Pseudomonas amygdali pv. photiniae]QWA53243.1 hypothetical protein C4C37_28605 [Pseudomonas amygdali pv. lachrymans]RMM50956.1 hypothetical protein ALQ79_200283 [Pseudomonas amygdali pv. lachrymans]RMV29488.1 hypothetical protein ALP12_200495 [Pseudomonas savastanoi pv. phaseolicola]
MFSSSNQLQGQIADLAALTVDPQVLYIAGASAGHLPTAGITLHGATRGSAALPELLDRALPGAIPHPAYQQTLGLVIAQCCSIWGRLTTCTRLPPATALFSKR